MSFVPMLMKELKELARSYKLLFVPIAFGLLGASQPITLKLLPQILEGSAGLPPGTVFEMPQMAAWQVMAGAIDQINQMGILILVLVTMGTVAGERASGVAATVLTKPVGRGAYLGAKAVAYSILAALSLALGSGLAAYYTHVLLQPVHWGATAAGTLVYLPNLVLAVMVTLFFSTFMPSPIAAGGAGIATVMVLNLVPRYLGEFLRNTFPGALTAASSGTLAGNAPEVAGPLLGVAVLIAAFGIGGWLLLERQEI